MSTITIATVKNDTVSNILKASIPVKAQNKSNVKKTTTASLWTILFSTVVYVYSVASLVSWWFFLVPNKYLPTAVAETKLYSMELAPKATSLLQAVSYNVGPMFLFGFAHSFLARKAIKKWMGIPISIERSVFCLQGAFFLHMIQHCWREVDTDRAIWDMSGYPLLVSVSLAAFWFGAAFLLSATFALDHFHLFGLSQGYGVDINRAIGLAAPEKKEGGLSTRWHYHVVAHPIMMGMFLTLWSTPVVTPSRLLCAGFLSLYILVAVLHFEERTIRDEIGTDYENYLAKMPRFFPVKLFVALAHRNSSSIMVNNKKLE
jgi:protein-S-isoprenylcysteine O-methyltransferase Ste14